MQFITKCDIFITNNIIGFYNSLEAYKYYKIEHLVYIFIANMILIRRNNILQNTR